jgi:hypothetical protein
MEEPVLIYFLQVTVPQMPMQSETRFANLIAELEDRVFHPPQFFAPFALFRG